MSDNLQKYVPEFDDDDQRERLSNFSREELLDMLIYAYKEKRVIAKALGEQLNRLQQIRTVLDEPSRLSTMPDIPGSDDIRKMLE